MRKAFTVAELLLTMTIIGIIAILVLPSFLKDYHKKIYTTRLKKTYEVLFSAMEQACIDNNVSYFYQTPYSKPNASDKQAEFMNKYFKEMENASSSGTSPFADKYKILSNDSASALSLPAGSAYARLKGGEAISLSCQTADSCTVIVDINSTEAPNVGGRDLFKFNLDTANNKVSSTDDYNKCGTDVYGTGCFSRIIRDNWVMNY